MACADFFRGYNTRSDLEFVNDEFQHTANSTGALIMGIFTREVFNTLEELLEHELKDLYDAEHRITEALAQMAEKASSPKLKKAFQQHLQETDKHIERLESVFEHRGIEKSREKCDAIVGLIQEGGEILSAKGDKDVLDAALIAAAQRVEHYEMAGYGTARAFARQLGDEYAAELLDQTLDEEKATDIKLTQIAEGSVNPASA
jgi:ferritin-like metal-binding protein YciE